MARFKTKNRRSKRKMTIPLAVVAGFLPLGVDVYNSIKGQRPQDIPNTIVNDLTGFNIVDPYHPQWQFAGLKRGLVPIVTGLAIHKFVGGSLGINRMLGNAGIPFIRI